MGPGALQALKPCLDHWISKEILLKSGWMRRCAWAKQFNQGRMCQQQYGSGGCYSRS